MKKIISIMLSLCLAVTTLAAALPSSVAAKTQVTPNLINTGDVEIDTDGSDGYSGDYVVIYNPSTSSYGDMSTGNMSGLIETEVGVGATGANRGSLPVSDKGYVVDIDSELAEADKKPVLIPAATSEASARNPFPSMSATHMFSASIQAIARCPTQMLSLKCLQRASIAISGLPHQRRQTSIPLMKSTRALPKFVRMSSIQSLH